MAKKMITHKIVTDNKLSIEGTLNVDNLQEGEILVEVEDIGEVDLKKYLNGYNGRYIKLALSEKTEEEIEEE